MKIVEYPTVGLNSPTVQLVGIQTTWQELEIATNLKVWSKFIDNQPIIDLTTNVIIISEIDHI